MCFQSFTAQNSILWKLIDHVWSRTQRCSGGNHELFLRTVLSEEWRVMRGSGLWQSDIFRAGGRTRMIFTQCGGAGFPNCGPSR